MLFRIMYTYCKNHCTLQTTILIIQMLFLFWRVTLTSILESSRQLFLGFFCPRSFLGSCFPEWSWWPENQLALLTFLMGWRILVEKKKIVAFQGKQPVQSKLDFYINTLSGFEICFSDNCRWIKNQTFSNPIFNT